MNTMFSMATLQHKYRGKSFLKLPDFSINVKHFLLHVKYLLCL